jgi:hypothetical protein
MLLSDEILSELQTAVYGTLVLVGRQRSVGQLKVGWSGPIGSGALTWPRKVAGDAKPPVADSKTASLGRASFFCRGSRVGCFDLDFAGTGFPLRSHFAGDTPATTVMLDRSPQFVRGMASRPQFRQDQLERDCHERSSIFLRNFRRCTECDQKTQVAKVAAIYCDRHGAL